MTPSVWCLQAFGFSQLGFTDDSVENCLLWNCVVSMDSCILCHFSLCKIKCSTRIFAAKQGRLCEIHQLRMNPMNENEFIQEQETSGTARFQHPENQGCSVKHEPEPCGCLSGPHGRIQEVNTASQKTSSWKMKNVIGRREEHTTIESRSGSRF